MGLGEYLKINIVCLTGGTNYREGKEKLKEGAQIVVGTPGRVIDLI
jgi:translation initiation factor 4A